MKKLNDLKIRTRLSIILGFVIFLIISISGIYSYTLNKERTINATNTEMYSQLQDMNYLINTQLNDNKKRLDY
nr:hypothetical protein [Bacteroidales bacterium]